MSRRNRSFLIIFSLFSFVSIIGVTALLYFNGNFDTGSDASGSDTCKVVSVEISGAATGTWSSSAIFTQKPPRYYLRIRDANNSTPCPDMTLSALSYVCNLNGTGCGAAATSSPWSFYRTDESGIARVDLYMATLGNKMYKAQFRPYSSTQAWSNTVSISIDPARGNSALSSVEVNLLDYVKYNPGDLYIFKSYQYMGLGSMLTTPVTGTTRLQIENEVKWGNYNVIPWRFTKDRRELYWSPQPAGTVSGGGSFTQDENLRWMIVSPNFQVTDNSIDHFDDYIWGIGHKSYLRESGNKGLKDVKPSNFQRTFSYASKTLQYPAYNIGEKQLTLPKSYFAKNANKYYSSPQTIDDLLPNPIHTSADYNWLLKIEKEPSSITVNGQSYSDVIRMDFYEGNGDFANGDILFRETWYFAKNIGLIKVDVKHFRKDFQWVSENPGKFNYIKNCKDDNDCMADHMSSPHVVMELQKYHKAQQISVQVSRNSSSGYCSDNLPNSSMCRVVVSKSANTGYSLKINNSTFTGYLEAKSGNSVIKWYWAENGVVTVPAADIRSLPSGSYKAVFRIWIPNEAFPNEQRIPTQLPWSNEVEVVLQS